MGAGVASQAPATLTSTSAEKPNESKSSKLQDKLSAANFSKKSNTQIALADLNHMIKQQNKIINGILAATDHLQACKEKSKSPVILEAIEESLMQPII